MAQDQQHAGSVAGRPSVFISYAHVDEGWKEALLTHLKAALGVDTPLELWDDRRLDAGADWKLDIEQALARAQVAVLVVSADFLASGFIQRVEVPTLLERRRCDGVRLMPLLARACPWSRIDWLASIQMRPRDAVPLTEHPAVDRALSDFASEVATLFDAPDPAPKLSRPAGAPSPPYLDPSPAIDRFGTDLAEAPTTLTPADSMPQTGSHAGASPMSRLKRSLRHGPRLHAGDCLGDGRYQLIQTVDQGGFATVWLGYDRRSARQVAVKVLHGQFSASRERRRRLFRGARQMAKLDHPHIVRVLAEPTIEDGWAFFVMEYLAGGDFRRAVIDGTLDIEQRLGVLERIAEALDYAHGSGLIHRDVKPGNILLDAAEQPKLTDFDLVRAPDTTGLTHTKASMGSYLYAAPESVEDAAAATAACDVYSLAVTLVFAIRGRELGPRFLIDRGAYLAKLDLPRRAVDVLQQALDLEPGRRFRSTGELCRRLRVALGPRPSPS